MSQIIHSLTPRQSLSAFIGRAAAIFNRYQTPIAIGAGVLGLVLIIVGPVRSALVNNAPSVDSGEESPVQAAGVGGLTASWWNAAMLDRDLLAFTTIPDRPRDRIITYTIRPGDTLFGIAAEFGLDPNTLFWSNSDVLGDSVHNILPGIELYILPVDGVYHRADGAQSLNEIAQTYGADVNAIIDSPYNELGGYTPSDVPPWGMNIVVPGGTREIVDWRPPITSTVNTRTGEVVVGFMQGMDGSCSNGIQGGGGTGMWIKPLDSYMVTTWFESWHSGIDLGAVLGTPVRAADTGVVIFSGWVPANWGYGILVVLDHGNGWTTYYAHLNSRSVYCGDVVPRGSYLGQVGSTGNSSGAHLHFEMRWGHVPDNPANYIGF